MLLVKANCEECGKEFKVQPCKLRHNRGKYCSRSCFYKALKKVTGRNHPHWSRVKAICQECGNEFEITLYDKKIRRFCSKKCWYKWSSKNRRRMGSAAWKGGNAKQICPWCGKEFEVFQSVVESGNGKYCSRKCWAASLVYNRSRSMENNPSWKGGISFSPYCEKFNKRFKERVRAFFGYICQKCGHVWQLGETRLAVHHVNYRKDSCCNENVSKLFVPVCKNGCHLVTNHNRKYWEKYFTDLINEKFGGKCYFTKEEMDEFKQVKCGA